MNSKSVKAHRKKLVDSTSMDRVEEFRCQATAYVERDDYQDILATEDCFEVEPMKYYSYNEYTDDGGMIVTMSEDEIIRSYWDYWYGKMVERFGKDHVDATYSIFDCIEVWVTVHWAWESTVGEINLKEGDV